MDGLDAALERARIAYQSGYEMISAYRAAAKDRDRLRKLEPSGILRARKRPRPPATHPYEADAPQDELEFWGYRMIGSVEDAATAQRDVLQMLSVGPGRGDYDLVVDALRPAAFILLDWLADSGGKVTITKQDDTRRDSYAVDFLMFQIADLEPSLSERDRRNAAFTIGREWLAARKPG